MPNWCNNTMSIIAQNKHSLTAFANKVGLLDGEPAFYYNSIVPEPDHEPLDGLNTIPEWHTWRNENWGCKWECGPLDESVVQEKVIDEFHSEVHYAWSSPKMYVMTFNWLSPWGPPTPVIQKAGEQYKDLAFVLYYEEPGMDFEGEFVMVNGMCSMDEQRECKPNFESLVEEYGADIGAPSAEDEKKTHAELLEEGTSKGLSKFHLEKLLKKVKKWEEEE